MPRRLILLLILCQAALCWLETWLISKISFIGKVGIATVHKEYGLLRSGWKTFLLLFAIQAVLIAVLAIIQKRYPKRLSLIVSAALLLIGVVGLFITFEDFLHTYTHRLLKERFHLGFYLFWLAWIGTSLSFIIQLNKKKPDTFPPDPNTPATAQEELGQTV